MKSKSFRWLFSGKKRKAAHFWKLIRENNIMNSLLFEPIARLIDKLRQ